MSPSSAPSAVPGPLGSVVDQVKPHLRGWLHLGMVPIALAAGAVAVQLGTALWADPTLLDTLTRRLDQPPDRTEELP